MKLENMAESRNVRAAVACVIIAIAIAAGALGAHALKGLISADSLSSYKTGVLYMLINGIGLLLLAQKQKSFAYTLILLGSLMFSLSIFGLSTRIIWTSPDNFTFLGPVTPLGGLFMIAGWMYAAWRFFKEN